MGRKSILNHNNTSTRRSLHSAAMFMPPPPPPPHLPLWGQITSLLFVFLPSFLGCQIWQETCRPYGHKTSVINSPEQPAWRVKVCTVTFALPVRSLRVDYLMSYLWLSCSQTHECVWKSKLVIYISASAELDPVVIDVGKLWCNILHSLWPLDRQRCRRCTLISRTWKISLQLPF